MGQVKERFGNLSLRKTLVLYVVFFTFAALLLCGATAFLCEKAVRKIYAAYPPVGERYYLTNEQGERLGEGTYISKTPTSLSDTDTRLLGLLDLLPMIMAPVYSALCILAAVFLFYRNRLKAPLDILKRASEKISQNDLDFTVFYDRKDEMGELCASFEAMRFTLAGSFSELWRSMEERKRLNAAFAHDLRTPLTVLKGYAEILNDSRDVQVRETAATMDRHLSRMESYVESMSRLQRLEDIRPERKDIPLQPFVASLYESADMLCRQNGKQAVLTNHTVSRQALLDTEFVLQVSNNLISNAVRYAKSRVELSAEEKKDGILLTVSDDGPGFERKMLGRATSPYATGESSFSGHFGLGLTICKMLCEHHGGWIEVENTSCGARVRAFFGGSV